ncbi:hypothetical protein D3C71_1520590 [compost metagenome]
MARMAALTTSEVNGLSSAEMRPTRSAVDITSSEDSANRARSLARLANARMTRMPEKFSLSTCAIRSSFCW